MEIYLQLPRSIEKLYYRHPKTYFGKFHSSLPISNQPPQYVCIAGHICLNIDHADDSMFLLHWENVAWYSNCLSLPNTKYSRQCHPVNLQTYSCCRGFFVIFMSFEQFITRVKNKGCLGERNVAYSKKFILNAPKIYSNIHRNKNSFQMTTIHTN